MLKDVPAALRMPPPPSLSPGAAASSAGAVGLLAACSQNACCVHLDWYALQAPKIEDDEMNAEEAAV